MDQQAGRIRYFHEKAVLRGKGKVSRQDMDVKVRAELARYHEKQNRMSPPETTHTKSSSRLNRDENAH
jgi:hypothetical protein